MAENLPHQLVVVFQHSCAHVMRVVLANRNNVGELRNRKWAQHLSRGAPSILSPTKSSSCVEIFDLCIKCRCVFTSHAPSGSVSLPFFPWCCEEEKENLKVNVPSSTLMKTLIQDQQLDEKYELLLMTEAADDGPKPLKWLRRRYGQSHL